MRDPDPIADPVAATSGATEQTLAASVIIPTYNKAKYLERTLASWLHQRGQDYELIVIDDGSADETQDVLQHFLPRLPLRPVRTENGGRAKARNRGLEIARGEVVIFSDDDRIVRPGFVNAHIHSHQHSDERCVVIGWQYGLLTEVRQDQNLAPERLLRLARANPEWERALMEGRPFETVAAQDIERDLVSAVELYVMAEPAFERVIAAAGLVGGDLADCSLAWMFGATGNLSVRRQSLDVAGVFDERFTGWGLEDTELHYRLARCGLKTRVQRDAVNYHQNHPRDSEGMAKSFNVNARRFFAKHPSLEAALFMQLVHMRIGLQDAEQIVREARTLSNSRLLAHFKQLLHDSVVDSLLRQEPPIRS